jgi:ribosomal protein S18 acetylase RimI-like enzyme
MEIFNIKRMTEIPIIAATATDAPEILVLQKTAYQSEAELYRDWTIPPLTQTLSQLEDEFSIKTFLKALQSDRIVGSVRASFDGGTCAIGRLIVHPDYQRKGIGTQLLMKIETIFSQAERFELFTGSQSRGNIHLYEKLGYRIFRKESLSSNVRLTFLEKRR